jgi:hypothetical protein
MRGNERGENKEAERENKSRVRGRWGKKRCRMRNKVNKTQTGRKKELQRERKKE